MGMKVDFSVIEYSYWVGENSFGMNVIMPEKEVKGNKGAGGKEWIGHKKTS